MKPRFAISFLLVTVSSAIAADALEYAEGDASVKESVQPLVSAIYNEVNNPAATRVFVLTRADPLDISNAHGTEIQGTFAGSHARAVVFVRTDTGNLAVEFYFEGDALRFTYQTFEFFQETAPPGSWRNFKDLNGWERRMWLGATGEVRIEASGQPQFPSLGQPASVRAHGEAILRLLRSRRTETSSANRAGAHR